ncbi:response regulator transcription factor [Streptomyces sp. NPDC001816]|uniref:response regulator transcription factor n=1 Tax=Streptomyces sp. NPDC001816 TaxID=3364612 RepID=UPI00367D49E2
MRQRHAQGSDAGPPRRSGRPQGRGPHRGHPDGSTPQHRPSVPEHPLPGAVPSPHQRPAVRHPHADRGEPRPDGPADLRAALDGRGTRHADIVRLLSCSEHTVKNVIYEVMSRLQARNRAHAVAHAVRHGLI